MTSSDNSIGDEFGDDVLGVPDVPPLLDDGPISDSGDVAGSDDLDLPVTPPPTADDPDDVLTDEEREQRREALDREQRELDELGRQRRQNVRVSVQYPIILRMGGRETHGRTRDLSATGVGFSTRFTVGRDDRGEIVIDFPSWTFTKKFVARFVKPILAGWQVGAQFDELSDDERERIVKEVFNVQRSQLQSRH